MERADLLTKLLSYAEKLKDTAAFQQIQKDQQKLFNDFNDKLMRAQYFLKKAKECITSAVSSSGLKKLTELNYNDIYLNMYSFSTKLHLLGNITKADDFKVDAMKLIDSSTSSQEISGPDLMDVSSLGIRQSDGQSILRKPNTMRWSALSHLNLEEQVIGQAGARSGRWSPNSRSAPSSTGTTRTWTANSTRPSSACSPPTGPWRC